MLSLVTMPRRALPEESAHLEGAADVPRPEGAAIQARVGPAVNITSISP